MKNVSKLFTSILMALSLVFVFSAADAKANDKIKAAGVQIKYVGSMNGKPVFQIDMVNQGEEPVTLALRDEHGNSLYYDVVKNGSYSKRIAFEDLDVDDLKLTLALRSKSGYQAQYFQISRNTSTVESVEVARVK